MVVPRDAAAANRVCGRRHGGRPRAVGVGLGPASSPNRRRRWPWRQVPNGERGDRRTVDHRYEHGGHDRAGADRGRPLLLESCDLRSSRPARLDAPAPARRWPGSRARVLEGMADDVDGNGLQPLAFTIRPGSFTAPAIRVSRDATRRRSCGPCYNVGEGGTWQPSIATAAAPTRSRLSSTGRDDAAPPTSHGLGAAGTDYPAEIVDLYPPYRRGSRRAANTAALEGRHRPDRPTGPRPYDIAKRAGGGTPGSPPPTPMTSMFATSTAGQRSVAECFATYGAATASTTPRRWRSSCATSGSRRGSSPGSCPANATRALVRGGQRECRPRMGRGVLPGLRVGHVRSDRGKRGGLTPGAPDARTTRAE